jgi:hypothetical protein
MTARSLMWDFTLFALAGLVLSLVVSQFVVWDFWDFIIVFAFACMFYLGKQLNRRLRPVKRKGNR